MNNKANYKKGHRRDITELLLQTGTIPLRTVMLTKDNSKGFRQQVYIMIKDGSLKTTGRGQEKVVTLSRYEDVKTDMQETIPKLIKYYEAYGQDDAYAAQSLKDSRRERTIRNAETHIFFSGTKYKTSLIEKESLFPLEKKITGCNYYSNREVKGIIEYQVSKDQAGKITGRTRCNGMVVSPGGNYIVYDSFNHRLETDVGENRIVNHCNTILSAKDMNLLKGGIILAKNYGIIERYINPSNRRYEQMTDNLCCAYPKIYGITLDKEGQRLTNLMTLPHWEERMYKTFIENTKMTGYEEIACNGKDSDGNYYMVFCSPDIKMLREFIRGARAIENKERCRIICFDFQQDFIVGLAKDYCKIFTVKFDDYVKEIGADV